MEIKYADRSTESNVDALVTGGTGLLGRFLLVELTRRGQRILVPIRNAAARASSLREFVTSRGGDGALLEVVDGDLDLPALGLDASSRARLARAKHVFHLGARFAWGLSLTEARRTNVAGSLAVVDLAASMPALERLVLVGGYRIGPRLDRLGRRVMPNLRAAGAYEASKHEAHRAAVERARSLGVPYAAVHPSSVIGDSRTGESTQVTGIGETILALADGKMPARVGGKSTYVPLVTVDFVARVLAELARDDASDGLELTLFDERTPVLDRLIDRAAAIAGVSAPRLRLPIGLVRCLPESITRTSREALEFLDDARYPLDETNAWLAKKGLAHPDFDASFERWVKALLQAHRGAEASARTQGSARA
jgi:dihydroflavonol-4-reductase